MNSSFTAVFITACLLLAVFIGQRVRQQLPEHHLSDDNKDTMKLAMGLVATMAALVLGLLLSSAKTSYDNAKAQVGQMAAKVAFLDRAMVDYGPETALIRARMRVSLEDAIREMWPDQRLVPVQSALPAGHGHDAVFFEIQRLSPHDDAQRSIKTLVTSLVLDLAQLRTALDVQSASSISPTLLIVVVAWLVAIFLSFSLFAPPNATATLALVVSALAVSGSIFLILELDQPFGGFIAISSKPLLKVMSQMAQ